MSVPNQKIAIIHKPKYINRFLQIGIDEWQEAIQQMNLGTFALYLYLAGNADGFPFELSQQAFENATGYKKTTYHDAVNNLITLGYLVKGEKNTLNYFTSPDHSSGVQKSGNDIPKSRKQPSNSSDKFSESPNVNFRQSNREIDNTDSINKIIDKTNRVSPRAWTGDNSYPYEQDSYEHDSDDAFMNMKREMGF